MATELKGVNVAMSTAFTAEERFDPGRFGDHIDMLIDAGVHGIVLNSGTGEFAYLDNDEAQEIISLGVRRVGGRVPVVAQTSAIGLTACINKSKAAVDAGVDGLMILPPWLDGPSERGVKHHYLSVADAVDTTIVIYNIPQETGFEMSPELWADLSGHANISYLKDSTGNIVKMQALLAAGQGVLGGCDPVAPYALMAGSPGWIWGAANVMPQECVALYDLIVAGNQVDALALWREKMLPFNLFIWNNSVGADYIPSVKHSVGLRFGDMGPVRAPQMPPPPESIQALTDALGSLLPRA
jgi:4-hydroxy-tetrahydrodipicolinate synthase